MSVGGNPPYGWAGPEPVFFFASNRTGSSLEIGELAVLDLAKSATETTDNTIGSENSSLANVIAVAAAGGGEQYGIVVVAMQQIADNGYGKFCARGIIKAQVGTSAYATDAQADDNALCYPLATKTYLDIIPTTTATVRALAIVLDDNTGTAFTANDQSRLVNVLFDGIHGVYRYAAS